MTTWLSPARVIWFDDAHDGPGWYCLDCEYPEEGSSGAYWTQRGATLAARRGYDVVICRSDVGLLAGIWRRLRWFATGGAS